MQMRSKHPKIYLQFCNITSKKIKVCLQFFFHFFNFIKFMRSHINPIFSHKKLNYV